VVEQLLVVLEKVCIRKGYLIIRSELKDDHNNDGGPKALHSLHRAAEGFMNSDLLKEEKGWWVWLLTNIDASGTQTRWQAYYVDSDIDKSLSSARGKLTVLVSFLDKDGKEITQEEINLAHHANPIHAKSKYGAVYTWLSYAVDSYGHEKGRRKAANVAVSPLALAAGYAEALGYKTGKTYQLRMKMTPGELRRLKDIKCEVQFLPDKAPGDARKRRRGGGGGR
jgi:hypothetical protein